MNTTFQFSSLTLWRLGDLFQTHESVSPEIINIPELYRVSDVLRGIDRPVPILTDQSNNDQAQQITLKIRDDNGSVRIPIIVSASTHASELKARLIQMLDAPIIINGHPHYYELIVHKHSLKDNETLASAGVRDGQELTLIPMLVRIFLCYTRADAKQVEKLYYALRHLGFKPWMDTKDIQAGEDWRTVVQQELAQSDFFMACLSNKSVNTRGEFQGEIRDALSRWRTMLGNDIYIIPVRLEDCAIPEGLKQFHWLNMFESDSMARLIRAIQEGLDRRRNSLPYSHPDL